MGFLHVEQKKGDPKHLDGQLIAYLHIDDTNGEHEPSPLDETVHGGIMAVFGDYRNQQSLKDFLHKEMDNMDDDSAMAEFVEELKKNDSGEFRKKLDSLINLEIIPVPAKVVLFDSEEALLNSEMDIFYLGRFKTLSHAHLSVTAFPILYQAAFREQEATRLQSEIQEMITQLENDSSLNLSGEPDSNPIDTHGQTILSYSGDLAELLNGEIIPKLIFNQHNAEEFDHALRQFHAFMQGYRFPEDIAQIEELIKGVKEERPNCHRKLELLSQKIAALQNEEFETVSRIQKELGELG